MEIFKKYIYYLGKIAEKDIEVKVAKFLPRGKKLIYLDLGCDDGEKTIKRASLIGTSYVLGVEVEKDRAQVAEKKNIKVYRVDLNKKWPFGDNSIDCITATEVIEHLIDLDIFFSEAKRVLKSKGKLIISTENLAAYHNIISLLLGNQPYTGPYLSRIYPIGHKPCGSYYSSKEKRVMNPHLNVMTIKSLRSLLQNNCFKILGIEGVAFYPLPKTFSNLMIKVDKYHSSYCVVVAEK